MCQVFLSSRDASNVTGTGSLHPALPRPPPPTTTTTTTTTTTAIMSHDSTPISTPEGSLYTPTESSSSSSSNLSFSQASFLEHPASSQTSVLSDATSSTSSSTSNSDTDDDDDDDEEAEAEWQESLRELNMLVSLVVIPFFGKWVGRKCAYWGWYSICLSYGLVLTWSG